MVEDLPAKMIISFLLLGCMTVFVSSQKLIVTHAPSYVTFQQQDNPLPTSDVSKLISHTLGLPSQTDIKWKGLKQGSVFKRPKANVLVTVLTVEGQPGPAVKAKAEFPVTMDGSGVDIDGLMMSLQGNFLDRQPLTVDTELDNTMFDVRSDFDVFRKIPNTMRRMADRLLDGDSVVHQHGAGTLNTSITSDLSLMGELQVIQDVLHTVKSDGSFMETKTPDVYSFTISGLKGVTEKHGLESSQTQDASNLVSQFLHKMTDQFKILYKDNVVVEILLITPPTGYVRKVRSLQAAPGATKQNLTAANLAMEYDQDYPVIFNIILWLMIILAIMMFSVAYGIWNMDPGRDSIIYRMTTTRLKKD